MARHSFTRRHQFSAEVAEAQRSAELLLIEIVDNTVDSLNKFRNIEINEQAQSQVIQTQVDEELLLVNRGQLRVCLVIHDDLVFNDQVQSKG